MPYKEIKFNEIVFNHDVYTYCINPKFTCPNYNHSWACPPAVLYLKKTISHFKKLFIFYSKFDVKAHLREEKDKNPKWSERRILNRLFYSSFISDILEKEIFEFLESNKKNYNESLIIWDGHCRICFNKEEKGCTYDSGKPCRYPDKIRYDMSAAGINTHETAKNLNIELEWPPTNYIYRVALVCFKE